MIPPELRDFETYIIGVSGGKDSAATAQWALETLPREKVKLIHNPTGAGWPSLSGYLEYLEDLWECLITSVRAGDKLLAPMRNGQSRAAWYSAPTLLEMIRLRGRWPSFWQRYCTRYLKQYPTRLFAHEFDKPILLLGIRAEESKSRARLPQFDLEDRGFRDSKRYKMPVYLPILHWSEQDVWSYLHEHGILPNPVYNHAARCGCWCCPLKNTSDEILAFCRLYPDIAQEAVDLEQEIGHTWKERQSIGNLLKQAQAQIPLFEIEPRFSEVGSSQREKKR